jgi:hypothetical protein
LACLLARIPAKWNHFTEGATGGEEIILPIFPVSGFVHCASGVGNKYDKYLILIGFQLFRSCLILFGLVVWETARLARGAV